MEKIFEIYLNEDEKGAIDGLDTVNLEEALEDYPFLFPEIEQLEIDERFVRADPENDELVYTVTRIAEAPECT